MEDKQLDFNQPLLSVRRFSSTVASEKDDKRKTANSLPSIPRLPFYRSELKSGPVRNPGTIPFLWEKSPGLPKDERKSRTQAIGRPPITPKLPPGRIMQFKQPPPYKVYEDSSVTGHEAGKVPSSSQSVSSVEGNIMKFESSKDAMEEKESSDSGDSDEAYQDALDTLSRTESFFINCSLSGLSGLDGPEVKPFGTFSTEMQTRDLMMGRFLPAAKAMASETPQHASWKQPVAREQPQQVKKVVSWDRQPPLPRSTPYVLPNYAEDYKEEESDDEDDDYDESGNLSTKVCGLLPRFCLKSSLCLLNPVPGMSVRTRVPTTPVSRMQARSSSAVSCQETEDKRTGAATHEKRSIGGLWKNDLREHKNAVRNKSNQVPYHSKSQKLEGTCLNRSLQSSGISLQQHELPQSSFYEEKGFLEIPKDAEIGEINGFISQKECSTSFQELLADQSTRMETGSASPMAEKTLYVDSVHKVVYSKLNSFSSDQKGLPKSVNNDLEIITKVRGLEEPPSVDSLLKDKNSNMVDEEVMLQPKRMNPADSSLLSISCKSDQEGTEMLKGFGRHEDICQESIVSSKFKFSSNGYLDIENQQQLIEVENAENSQEINSQFPLPPPLPKSPSDSWLWRTLPNVSSRNSSSRSYVGTRMHSRHQASKMPSVDPKWQTIVKTTKVQHQL